MAEKLTYESRMPAVDAAQRLSELALGLSAGRVRLRAGKREAVCYPTGTVTLRVEVKESSKKGRLELEIEWPVGLQVSGDELELRTDGG
ncbi:MAG TPA: amphi-Trp domain-containing protein [Dehalococcoidia bacterium]|nr:amphi-Trp domain-containing protein [Dehalococcoidia bacterium]